MKFEKFLKRCGTHGLIVKRTNGDKWLICDGVGMKVPPGVVNLLGAGEVSEETREIVEAIVTADTDDRVELREAYLLAADGKASDIVRIFGDDLYDETVRISNDDFGLLEKSDVLLAYLRIEDDEDPERNADILLVLAPAEDVIGFITGVPRN